ncbi:MAG: DUF3604 domain-containing protein [Actinobacteria bacterium]|nr:DUF3604 domain-containing protein [Actinomycetota bacterium]
MPQTVSDALLGTVTLEASPVIAGAFTTFSIRFTAGRVGIDDRGALRVAWRAQADLATPQLTDPAADNYVAVRCVSPNAVRPAVHFHPRGHRRPYICAISVAVDDAGLWPGDCIEFIFGERTGGSRGIRAPITVCRSFDFQIAVDAKGTQHFLELPGTVGFPVVAGPPVRIVPIAPSDAVTGQPVALRVRYEDAWGNPTAPAAVALDVRLVAAGDRVAEWHGRGAPVVRIEPVLLRQPGVVRLAVHDAVSGLGARTNPTLVHAHPPRERLWWGDLHGQSGESVGTNPSADYFRYARDLACADFTCHQANDFQVDDAFWARLQGEVEAINADGSFVCFHGWEWSGNTEVGGDRNVMFRDRPGPGDLVRSGHWLIDRRPYDPATDAATIDELYAKFRGRNDVMFVPHVGGRRAELRWFEPDLEPVVEVHSAHGTSEFFLEQALATGKMVGFIAGSDDHLGRPGATMANSDSFPVGGGLAAIWSPRLDRRGLWEGLKRRSCYGTSGPRLQVVTSIADAPMGADTRARGAVPIYASVHGTAPVVEVSVYRDGALAHRWTPGDQVRSAARSPSPRGSELAAGPAPEDEGGGPNAAAPPDARVLVAWTGNLRIARGRKLGWDGGVRVSGATIARADGVGFDHPEEGLTEVAAGHVRWRSETSGDYDGVLLSIRGGPDAALQFETPPATCRQTVGDLAAGPVFHPAAGAGSHVRFQRLPSDGPGLDTELAWTDPSPSPGVHAYHVRVLQLDGHMAWTSPTWVTVERA